MRPVKDPFDKPVQAEAEDGSVVDRALRRLLPEPYKSAPGLEGVLVSGKTTEPSSVIGSKVGPCCEGCGAHVWMSPSSIRSAEIIKVAVCVACFVKAVLAEGRKDGKA
jgi:hypothetical protein